MDWEEIEKNFAESFAKERRERTCEVSYWKLYDLCLDTYWERETRIHWLEKVKTEQGFDNFDVLHAEHALQEIDKQYQLLMDLAPDDIRNSFEKKGETKNVA